MRAFFAVPVPADVGLALMSLVPPIRGVRRGEPGRLHLTLHFLADAPDDLAQRLPDGPWPGPFRVTPGRLILLPTSGPVRVVAASVRGEGLASLHAALGTALQWLRLPTETRPFLPHITLARCAPPLPQQVRRQTPMAPRADLSFVVDRFELIESRLGAGDGGTAVHRTLATWALSPPGSPQPPATDGG